MAGPARRAVRRDLEEHPSVRRRLARDELLYLGLPLLLPLELLERLGGALREVLRHVVLRLERLQAPAERARFLLLRIHVAESRLRVPARRVPAERVLQE